MTDPVRGQTAGAGRRGLVLSAYFLGGYLAGPILSRLYARRAARGKEIASRRNERFGYPDIARPDGPLVWVHAASVGETNAVLPLVEWICGRGVNVLLTTGTVTSAQVAEARLPRAAIHQFVPFDVPPAVTRFLDHWRPSLAIMVESEIWPATLSLLGRRNIPVMLVNARMSERSHRGWSRMGRSARATFASISTCLAQSERDAERFSDLGVGDVRIAGNLKFDVEPPAADDGELDALRKLIGGRRVWVAASTHEGEEEAAGRIHAALREQDPDLMLICAPRHPERGLAVADALTRQGHDVSLRSRGEMIRRGTSVYVADTIGEMGLFYRLAPVSFVGGSLVSRGGQNPIEPAQLGCAVVSGPSVRNFVKVYEALADHDGAVIAADEDGVREALARLLFDTAERDHVAASARAVVTSWQGALGRVISVLDPLVGRLVKTSGKPDDGSGPTGA